MTRKSKKTTVKKNTKLKSTKNKKSKVKVSKKITSKKSITPNKNKVVKIPDNQIENLSQWLEYYKQNKKLPYNRIICTNCSNDFVSLKGIALSHAMKKFDNNIESILTNSVCKTCKEKTQPAEKKEKAPIILSREEMEARREAISATLPKIDFYKTRVIYNIAKDKDMCKEYTKFACHRPDIYLDLGCNECALNKHCACPIKDISRIADGRHKNKRK